MSINVPEAADAVLKQWDTAIAIILRAYPDKGESWAKTRLWKALRNVDEGVSLMELLATEFNIKVEVEK